MQLAPLANAAPKVVRNASVQDVVMREPDLTQLPVLTTWPLDGGPFITLPLVITKDPQHRAAKRRHVSHASIRRDGNGHALAASQARSRARRRMGGQDSGRGRRRNRSSVDVCRHCAVAAGARRVCLCRAVARPDRSNSCKHEPSICSFPPKRSSFWKVRRQQRLARRRSVRRSYGRLQSRRSLSDVSRHVRDASPQSDLRRDRRRQAADGRRLVGQSHRTPFLAAAANRASRSRRHESSGRRRVSQSRHRVDSQVVSRPREESHERALGTGTHDDADARARDRRRRRRRPGLPRASRGSCSTISRPIATSS